MRSRAKATPSRHVSRPTWPAIALIALVTAGSLVALPAAPAQAAVPAGYVTVSGWTASGTNATATTIGGSTTWGSVTTAGTNQTVGMTTGWNVDAVQVPRRQFTAASVTASTTACLNGAPVDTLRECNGATTKITTITFPHPVVDPIIAIASRGAISTVNSTYCAPSWTDHTITAVGGASNFLRSRVSPVTIPAGQLYNTATTEVSFDPSVMSQTANECLTPASGTGTVAYIRISGVVDSVQFQTRWRSMVTRNNAPVQTTRNTVVPPGWQFQPYVTQPADLVLAKTATAQAVAGEQIEYRLSLTNKGPGPSHGFEIEDALPAGVTGASVASSPIPCTVGAETIGGVSRQVVRCSVTPPTCILFPAVFPAADLYCDPPSTASTTALASGASVGPIVIRATAPTAPGTLSNTARVWGADFDPVPADNSSTATTTIVEAAPGLGLSAAATPPGPVELAIGASIQYSFTLTNTGNVPLTSPIVVDDSWTGAGAAPVISCPAGAIAVAGNLVCTAAHTVTQADIDRGSVALTAVALAESVGGDAESPPATATTQLSRSAALALATSSSPALIESIGQSVTLSFIVTNTGTATVAGASVTLSDFTGAGDAPLISCPEIAFAPGASVTCTAAYAAIDDDTDVAEITGTATATATAPTGVTTPVSGVSTLAIPVIVPEFEVTKTADIDQATPLVDGTVLTYTLTAANVGDTVLDPVVLTDDLAGILVGARWNADALATIWGASAGTLSETADALSWTGALAPGESVVVTYSVTARSGASAQSIVNSAGGEATVRPGSVLRSPTISLSHTVVGGSPALTLTASAQPASPVELSVGAPVTFSFVLANTGDVLITAPSVVSATWTGTGAAPIIVCPAGPIAPLATITCTASHIVDQADIDRGGVALTATGAASWAAGSVSADPATASVELIRTASLSIVTSSTLATIDTVGQLVPLSFLVLNTGTVTVTDPVVAYAAFSGAGAAPAVTCPSGAVPPGSSVTCTSFYLVVDGDTPARELTTTATATATPPGDLGAPVDAAQPLVVPVRIAALTFAKTADAPDGSEIADGTVLTYLLVLTNTGGAILDPVVVSDDLAGVVAHATRSGDAVSTIDGATSGSITETATDLSWAGALAPGETLEITYAVTVRGGETPGEVVNAASVAATAPVTMLDSAARTTHTVAAVTPEPPDPVDPPTPPAPGEPSGPTYPDAVGALSSTGQSTVRLAQATAAAGSLLLLGAGLLMTSRRRRAEKR